MLRTVEINYQYLRIVQKRLVESRGVSTRWIWSHGERLPTQYGEAMLEKHEIDWKSSEMTVRAPNLGLILAKFGINLAKLGHFGPK